MATTDMTALSDIDLEALRAAVRDEQARREVIATAAANATATAGAYATAVASAPAMDGGSVPAGGWGPGQKVTFAGTVYINQSGAWLSVGPNVYAMGWRLATPPTGAPAWKTGTAYKVGDQVTYQSVVYKCLQAHTSQVGWEPPNVPALWAVA